MQLTCDFWRFFSIPILRSTPARYDTEVGNTAITREEDLKKGRVRRGECIY